MKMELYLMKNFAIEINNLTKYYRKTIGIEKLDLTVEEGEIFGFIGPNGAGKSTTIRLLFNLIFPDSGSGRIFGYDIVKQSKEIKQITGYLPAEVNYYYKMSVGELLEYSQKFYKINDNKRIYELTEELDINPKLKIRDLSLGNKKKVSLIQSILHNPQLLVLDEPTSALDPLVQSKVFDIFKREHSRGSTIFFSSHVLSDVQKICSKVAIIQSGRIIKVESIDTLRKKMLKKIAIKLVNSDAEFNINLSGISDFYRMNNQINFMYNGDMNHLTSALAILNLDNLTIEEPTLEEIFFHYYTKETN